MTKKIIFTDVQNPEGVLEKPKPSSEYLPDWYKKARSYLNDENKQIPSWDGSPTATVKKCMPVWDMLTAGYIMETPYDIYIKQTPSGPHFLWGEMKAIEFSPKEQLQGHPWLDGHEAGVRLIHPWSIKTPKGWSVLVMNPVHREKTMIEVAPAIIDTDTYSLPINIFIKLLDLNFEGMIPRGTPLVQIIPFKRESWISKLGGIKEKNKHESDLRKFGTVFFDRYKKFWWNRKSYK